jgi:uncharacterized protein (DUF1330 family)
MTTYAVGHLTKINVGPDIIQYLDRIDATLVPFSGRFLIHGGEKVELEGKWEGDLILISFPTRKLAEDWYRSHAYQDILPLRLNNSEGQVFLIDSVKDSHRAPDVLRVG